MELTYLNVFFCSGYHVSSELQESLTKRLQRDQNTSLVSQQHDEEYLPNTRILYKRVGINLEAPEPTKELFCSAIIGQSRHFQIYLLLFFLESQLITKPLHQMFHGLARSALCSLFRCLQLVLQHFNLQVNMT